MKMVFMTLALFTAQTSTAASLYCDVYNGSDGARNQSTPIIHELPAASEKVDYIYFEIATLDGVDVMAEVVVTVGFSEHVNLYTNMNGVRVYTGTRALLINDNKNVIDAHCEINNPTPYANLPPLGPGPTVD